MASDFSRGDITGVVVWVLCLTKLLFFDFDRAIADGLGSPWDQVVQFRSLLVLAVIAIFLIAHKRGWIVLVYAAVFPVIVIFWKIPRLLIWIRSWNILLAFITLLISSARRFRLRFLIRTVEAVAAVVAIVSTTPWISVTCAILFSFAIPYHRLRYLIITSKLSQRVPALRNLCAINDNLSGTRHRHVG